MKYSILRISPFIFMNMCKPGIISMKVVKNAIPEDAKYVRSFTDDTTGWGNISIVIESESFADLSDGDPIPVLQYPHFENI